MGFNPKDAKFKNNNNNNNRQQRTDNNNKSCNNKKQCKVSQYWSVRGSCIVRNQHTKLEWEKDSNGTWQPKTRAKISAFDLDQTLIRTKSGAKFPRDQDDFEIWDPSVITKLQELSRNGYHVVIFTNQLNSVERGIETQIMHKIDQIANLIGIPISAYISVARDVNRKPQLGMFTHLLRSLTSTLFDTLDDDDLKPSLPESVIDLDQSFYVGDASGRPGIYLPAEIRGHPPTVIFEGDHSADDLDFAINLFCFQSFYAGSTTFNKSGGVTSLSQAHQDKIHQHFFVPEVFFKQQDHFNYWQPATTTPPTATATATIDDGDCAGGDDEDNNN